MGLKKREYMQKAGEIAAKVVTNPMPQAAPTQYYTTQGRTHCHAWGLAHVATVEGVRFYGTGWNHGARPMQGAIHLNLAPDNGRFCTSVQMEGFVDCPQLTRWATSIKSINIDWPDFDTPTMPRAFWTDLVGYLSQAALDRQTPLNVVTACLGGHGRTGTALSIMLGLLNVRYPIDFVRGVYCVKAVETIEQELYVENILQRVAMAPLDQNQLDLIGETSIYNSEEHYFGRYTIDDDDDEEATYNERYSG